MYLLYILDSKIVVRLSRSWIDTSPDLFPSTPRQRLIAPPLASTKQDARESQSFPSRVPHSPSCSFIPSPSSLARHLHSPGYCAFAEAGWSLTRGSHPVPIFESARPQKNANMVCAAHAGCQFSEAFLLLHGSVKRPYAEREKTSCCTQLRCCRRALFASLACLNAPRVTMQTAVASQVPHDALKR